MPKLIPLLQGSKEWLAWRKWKIGASMSSAVMGISPWQTPTQLWESIVLDTSLEKNFAMERGSRLEKDSLRLHNKSHEFCGDFLPACFEHSTIPWMIASMDGAIVYAPGVMNGQCSVIAAIEIKAPGKEAHSMALNGIIPPYYYPQVQHQMVVCDLQKMDYISFDGVENVVVTVLRDDEYITKQLMPKLATFYQSLIDFKPPEPGDKDLIEITNLDALKMAREYSEITHNIEELQKVQERLKEQICGYATHGRCKIGDLRVTKVMRRGNLDYQKFLKDKDLKVPDSYRKENSVSWRIA